MKITSLKYIIFIAFLLLPGVSLAAQALSVRVEGGQEAVTLTWPGTGKTKIFTLSSPERLVIDLPSAPGMEVSLPPDYTGKMIARVRSARFNAATTRVVFELAQTPGAIQTKSESGKNTVIRIALSGEKSAAEPKPAAPRPVAKPRNDKPMVVIDAGHGGQDPGTSGPGGTREKDVVLRYARALRDALLATGRYRVYLTRDDDRFIMLRERIALARKAGGDLFISLHADSAPGVEARGLSVYTVSEKASDAEAAALAARENRVDEVYGMDISKGGDDVANILRSLAQRDTMLRSEKLAGSMVIAMNGGRVRLLPNAHRFAGFAVLKSPDIPSVLVEIGFLTHPQEEKLLLSDAHRDKIITALTRGVDAYFQQKRRQP